LEAGSCARRRQKREMVIGRDRAACKGDWEKNDPREPRRTLGKLREAGGGGRRLDAAKICGERQTTGWDFRPGNGGGWWVCHSDRKMTIGMTGGVCRPKDGQKDSVQKVDIW